MRIARRVQCVCAAVLALFFVVAPPALAQDVLVGTALPAPEAFQITAASLRKSAQDSVDTTRDRRQPVSEKPDRPAALFPLYGSLITLQGLDFHSTRRALGSGSGREANPAMREVVNNSAAFLAVKAGATVGVIWASEKMWKKNRKAAVIFSAVVNAALAGIVANNYRLNSQRSGQ